MSRVKAKPEKKVKPLAVIDFTCDGCGGKLPGVLIVEQGVLNRIAKTFCEGCWAVNTMNPKVSVGVN